MIADFAIHDKGNGSLHAHILLTMRVMDFLRKKEISTVESLDTRLDEISQTAVFVMWSMKKSEKLKIENVENKVRNAFIVFLGLLLFRKQ